jgi:hypothetical protein
LLSGNLFKVNPEQCHLAIKSEDKSLASLWHRRLGHPYFQKMQEKSNAFIGLNKTVSHSYTCSTCVDSKAHRSPFPKSSGTSTRKIFQIVHCDIKGPTNAKARTVNRYFSTFTDDFSRFSCVVLIRKKVKQFMRLENTYLLWKTSRKQKSKVCAGTTEENLLILDLRVFSPK